MGYEDVAIALSIMICIGIVIGMLIKMHTPEQTKEENAEVIKKYKFVDQNYKENGIRVAKTLYSISFLINGKKKTYYCGDGLFHYVKEGDNVKIVHNKFKIIDIELVKE